MAKERNRASSQCIAKTNNLTKPHFTDRIAGVEISTDAEGRFNLNSLHRASEAGESKEPNKWLRNKQAQELIDELSANLSVGHEVVKTVKGGMAPGTFAHELLAVEYAGWISPAFRLKVNQTFIDYRTGKLASQENPLSLSRLQLIEMAMQAEKERLALESIVQEQAPKVEAFDRIATKSNGSMCVTDAAKHLQIRPKSLFKMLTERHWIYRRAGGKSWLGYQDKIQAGKLEHKINTVPLSDGSEKIVEQVLITAKGLGCISEMLGLH
ncbi:phage antirepressor KilAC domain-containing protein [Pectobacterium cacticida]|uniref:phage antirepressor KilAC domain-containing protein n=1 Tax=Pectobacterium cacticida TaxID=69221 RepID=UPI003987F6F0